MRSLILLVSVTIIASCSCGQTNLRNYYFSEIGMTVSVPTEFKSQDSFARPKFLDTNNNQIEDPKTINELSADIMKLLLMVESDGYKNSISINILPVTKKSIQTFGDSVGYLEFSKNMLMASARQFSENFDTLFTTVRIDKFLFNKLFTKTIVGQTYHYNGMYFTKIKGSYVVIKIDYEDEKVGKKLESIIEDAKFE
jgi:hypothetical protein